MERKKVDSKLILFTLVLVLITLLLLNSLLKGKNNDTIWDYDKIESANGLISYGEKNEDRNIYYILENIVANYLNSYIDIYKVDSSEDSLSYKDYYKYLTKDYKSYLGQSKYNEVATNFLNKFYIYSESDVEAMEYMETNNVIKEVYNFENNIYLCRLQNSFNGKVGYIAIKLQTSNNSYSIAYIE